MTVTQLVAQALAALVRDAESKGVGPCPWPTDQEVVAS